MRRFGWLSFIFLFALCLSLLLNMPLTQLLARTGLPDDIRLANIQATISGGDIDIVAVHDVLATNLHFDIDLSCLWVLQLCYHVKFDQGQGMISVHVLDGSLMLTDTRLNYPLETLITLSSEYLKPFPVKPSGDLQIEIGALRIVENKILLHQGRILWSQAGLTGETIDLGEYQLSVALVDQSYRLDLTDHKAALAIKGQGRLQPNGQYDFKIDIKARPGLNQSVKGALGLFAREKTHNQYSLQHTGRLTSQSMNYLTFIAE